MTWQTLRFGTSNLAPIILAAAMAGLTALVG